MAIPCLRRSDPYGNITDVRTRNTNPASNNTCSIKICKRRGASHVVHVVHETTILPRETFVQQPQTCVSGGEITQSNGTQVASGDKDIQQESLVLLEWPSLCRQVGAFASTLLAARRIMLSGLPIGRSQVIIP